MATYTPRLTRAVAGPTQNEIMQMAEVLRRHHGSDAFEAATYFAVEQEVLGDSIRAKAWSDVAHMLRITH